MYYIHTYTCNMHTHIMRLRSICIRACAPTCTHMLNEHVTELKMKKASGAGQHSHRPPEGPKTICRLDMGAVNLLVKHEKSVLHVLGYVRVHFYIYSYVYIHSYMFTHVCVYTYMYSSIAVYMFTFLHLLTYIHIYIYTYIYVYIYIYRHPRPTTRTPLKKHCKYRYKRRFFPNPILELFLQIGIQEIQKPKNPKIKKIKNSNLLHLRNLAIVFGFLDFRIFLFFYF